MNERIEELESRVAWYEKQLSDLSEVVHQLYNEVARLRREMDAHNETASRAFGTEDEKPPHY